MLEYVLEAHSFSRGAFSEKLFVETDSVQGQISEHIPPTPKWTSFLSISQVTLT